MVSLLGGNDIDRYTYQIAFESSGHLYMFGEDKDKPIQFAELKAPLNNDL